MRNISGPIALLFSTECFQINTEHFHITYENSPYLTLSFTFYRHRDNSCRRFAVDITFRYSTFAYDQARCWTVSSTSVLTAQRTQPVLIIKIVPSPQERKWQSTPSHIWRPIMLRAHTHKQVFMKSVCCFCSIWTKIEKFSLKIPNMESHYSLPGGSRSDTCWRTDRPIWRN